MPVNVEGLQLEKFDAEKYKQDVFTARRRKFDRKTFNPFTNTNDRAVLNRLRAPGYKRWYSCAFGRWQSKYGTYSTRFNNSGCYNWALEKVSKGDTIIDAGCGDSGDSEYGAYHGLLAKAYDLFPRRETVTCGDVILGRLSHFYIQDICEPWPDADNSVSAICCNAVLDLVNRKDRNRFYREAYRVLKPGGRLVIEFVRLVNGYGFNLDDEKSDLSIAGFSCDKKYGYLLASK